MTAAEANGVYELRAKNKGHARASVSSQKLALGKNKEKKPRQKGMAVTSVGVLLCDAQRRVTSTATPVPLRYSQSDVRWLCTARRAKTARFEIRFRLLGFVALLCWRSCSLSFDPAIDGELLLHVSACLPR